MVEFKSENSQFFERQWNISFEPNCVQGLSINHMEISIFFKNLSILNHKIFTVAYIRK